MSARKKTTKKKKKPAKNSARAKKRAPAHPAGHVCKRCASTRRDNGRPKNAPKRARPKRTTSRNPKRPPRGWWDDCIAHVEARDGQHVRSARAVCGATWWDLPAKKREAIVRRMERSSNPQQRAAAHAIARAERSHARRRRKSAGRSSSAPRSNPPKQLVSLVYKEQKPGDEKPYEYEHDFSRSRAPKLVEKRGRLVIKGGGYEMKDGWIHG